jgi:hypothetical protein
MHNIRTRVTLAFTVLSATAIVAAPVANASAPGISSWHTSAVQCSSSNVWLRLWGVNGAEYCYTGNGSAYTILIVVSREQINGVHVVCLSSTGINRVCSRGPANINLIPPEEVSIITIGPFLP